jgi:proline iminopeptidase
MSSVAGRNLYPAIEPYRHGLLDVGDGNRIYWEE